MATITKTQATSLISLQELASAAVVIGTAADVATKLSATFFARIGRCATTGLTVPAQIRIEASAKSSGDGFWYPIHIFGSSTAASESEAVSGTEAASSTVIEVASTTNLTAGDVIFFRNGTPANSEWARIKSIVTNTSVTLEEGIVNAQTSSTIYDQADIFSTVTKDLSAIGRIRAVVDNSGTGQTIAAEVWMVTGDSIG